MSWKKWGERGAAGILAGVLAFFAVGQIRSQPGLSERLQVESEQDLTRIFAGLNGEAAALNDEITELRIRLRLLQSSAQRDQVARQSATRELEDLEVLAGTVGATGPGVVVTIDDPFRAITFDTVLALVQELRNARAEAIAINGIRVGASTYFEHHDDALVVGGVETRPPYVVKAIGEPATLEGGLEIPGGAIDTLESLDRVDVSVERQSEIRVPAVQG